MKMDRRYKIRELVKERGHVTVAGLSEQFGVSETTIRRDLQALSAQGWLRRAHGGAVQSERVVVEEPAAAGGRLPRGQFARLGRAAARLIQPEETVFLCSGAAVLEVARNLDMEIPLTVITNSISVVNELVAHPRIEILVVGGVLQRGEGAMFGHVTERAIGEFRADRAFVGVQGVDLERGLTARDPATAMVLRSVLSISARVVLVADASYFGRVGPAFIAPVSSISALVTDDSLPSDVHAALGRVGVEVISA